MALDIACGRGSNALFLASMGMRVDAWDISPVAIRHLDQMARKKQLDIRSSVVNITPEGFLEERYDLILNCHYLDRSLSPAIKSSLKPGGIVMFQTFTENKIMDIGPSNPEFLLKEDELLRMFEDLEKVVYLDESQNSDKDNPLCGRACLIARKPGAA